MLADILARLEKLEADNASLRATVETLKKELDAQATRSEEGLTAVWQEIEDDCPTERANELEERILILLEQGGVL